MHQNASFIRIKDMDTYDKLFSNLEPHNPSGDLSSRVLANIKKHQRQTSLRRFVVFSFVLLASIVAMIPAVRSLVSAFKQSGFIEFMSLIFSDTSMIAVYWKNFMFILLETLPVVSIAIFLTVLFSLLESIKFILKDIRYIFRYNN